MILALNFCNSDLFIVSDLAMIGIMLTCKKCTYIKYWKHDEQNHQIFSKKCFEKNLSVQLFHADKIHGFQSVAIRGDEIKAGVNTRIMEQV